MPQNIFLAMLLEAHTLYNKALNLTVNRTALCSKYYFSCSNIDEVRQPFNHNCKNIFDECLTVGTNKPRILVEPWIHIKEGKLNTISNIFFSQAACELNV